MATTQPMLDDLTLQQVQVIDITDDEALVTHAVPGLQGDFDQPVGRRGAAIDLSGVLTGAEVGSALEALRTRFGAGEPVPFTADIATALTLDQVLIETMDVREVAGRPQRFEYAFRLREFTPVPPPGSSPPPPEPTPPPPAVDTGTLIVEVAVEGRPDFDFGTVVLTVEGTTDAGAALSRTLTRRAGGTWTEQGLPPGRYTARAVVTAPEAMSGSADAVVRAGQTASVRIVLRPGVVVARAFVVHFRFDKSFVEPCMRMTLRDVARYAAANPDDRLVMVGHTDKVGPPAYNQSLSERRARAVFAHLTSGRDPAAALAELDALRRPAGGGPPSIQDGWATRQYQHMLQDLGFYPGNVDGDHGAQTDDGVRAFRAANGLPAGTRVDDPTWDALIAAYLAQDADVFTLPEAQLLPNAAGACDGGPLKWLGCGEDQPLPLPQPTRLEPWRPYRRVELLFVRAAALPCALPEPVTFTLPAPGAVSPRWCLGPGDTAARCCFASRTCDGTATRWCITPAETGTVTVGGSFVFEDGSPAPGTRYVLIAPDGEYMDGERAAAPGSGEGIPARADAAGAFAYPALSKGPGWYTLEVLGPFTARRAGEPPAAAKGNIVCVRLDPGDRLDVILRPGGATAPAVTPVLTPAATAVVVRKPHTAPARQAVAVGVSGPFFGIGLLGRSSAAIRFFSAAVGGIELTFDGTDNLFTGAQLTAGVTIFAEGATPSAVPGDVVLDLALVPAVAPPATAAMTAVELTLDVCVTRVSAAVEPAPLSAADKVAVGRFVQVQDPLFEHERAILIIRPPNPPGFPGDLVLRPIAGRVAAFVTEVPAAGQAAAAEVIPGGTVPAAGLRLFAEASALSPGVRDTGFRLGLAGIEDDGDRIPMTAVQVELMRPDTAGAPPVPLVATTFARFGLWDRAYGPVPPQANLRNGAAEAANFIGVDRRRLHLRVGDPAAAGSAQVDWRTLRVDRADDDAPPSQALTLPPDPAGGGRFLSRGIMLVTDDTDRDVPTDSGLTAPLPDVGVRARGQSNHRLRRAAIDGFVRAEYSPAPGQRLRIVRPAFNRNPDERLRITPRVVRYTNAADGTYVPVTDARILEQFSHANLRWNQLGIQIDRGATEDRPIPAGALRAGKFPFAHPNGAEEVAALRDLLPGSPDDTLTVVFVDLTGANAYAAILPVAPIPNPPGAALTMGDRFFIFMHSNLDARDETLAHELHHVLFNRFDTATDRQFFTLNTNAPTGIAAAAGIALPDARIYRRVQNRNSPDPDRDATNDNIVNWARRRRTARFPQPLGLAAATATTGNTLLRPF